MDKACSHLATARMPDGTYATSVTRSPKGQLETDVTTTGITNRLGSRGRVMREVETPVMRGQTSRVRHRTKCLRNTLCRCSPRLTVVHHASDHRRSADH